MRWNLISQKIPQNLKGLKTLLLETRDLMTANMNLLEQYYKEYDGKVPPARLDEK